MVIIEEDSLAQGEPSDSQKRSKNLSLNESWFDRSSILPQKAWSEFLMQVTIKAEIEKMPMTLSMFYLVFFNLIFSCLVKL